MLRQKPRPCTLPVPPHACPYGRHSNDGRSSHGDSPRQHRKNRHVMGDLVVDGTLRAADGLFMDDVHATSAITSGNISVGGSAEICGATVFKGKVSATSKTDVEELKVRGDATLERNLDVKACSAQTLSVSDKASFDRVIVNKGLLVHGECALDTLIVNSRLEANHGIQVKKSADVLGDAIVAGDFKVQGGSHFHDAVATDLNVTGTCKSNKLYSGDLEADVLKCQSLQVGDEAKLDKNLIIKGSLDVRQSAKFRGNADFNEDLTVHGSATFDGCIEAKAGLTVQGSDASIKENMNIGGDLDVHKTCSVSGDLDVRGSSKLQDVHLADSLSVAGPAAFKARVSFEQDVKLEAPMEAMSTACFQKEVTVKHDMEIGGKLLVDDSVEMHSNVCVVGDLEVVETIHCCRDICACGSVVAKQVKTNCITSDVLIQRPTVVETPQWTCTPYDMYCYVIASSRSAILFELHLGTPSVATRDYQIQFNLGCVPKDIKHGVCVLGFDCNSCVKQDAFTHYTSSIVIRDSQLLAAVNLTRKAVGVETDNVVTLSLIISWIG